MFPLYCSCGLQTNEDGTTLSLRDHQLGDRVAIAINRGLRAVGLRKPRQCGCEGRKRWLNRAGTRLYRAAWRAAGWIHPR